MLEYVGQGRQEQGTHAKAAGSTGRESVRNSIRYTTPDFFATMVCCKILRMDGNSRAEYIVAQDGG